MSNFHWFADKTDEVNWNAKCEYSKDFICSLYQRILLHTEEFTINFTSNKNSLNYVIPISGGLDSSIVTWLIADTTNQSLSSGKVKNGNILLLNFVSSESSFAEEFYKLTKRKYSEITTQFTFFDTRRFEKKLGKYSNTLFKKLNRMLGSYNYLTNRIRDSISLELAERLNYCLVDSFNMTEYVIGEFTSGTNFHYSPMLGLYKSVVYELSKIIGLPDVIRQRRPINSVTGRDKLECYFGEMPPNIKPEDAYKVLDLVLYKIYNKKQTYSEVSKELNHSKKFTKKVEDWVRWQQYRRELIYFNPFAQELSELLEISI